MEKQYRIEFPALMAGKKVMYVHGFASSAQSGTVGLLRQLMPQAEVVADDVPLDPQEAIAFLRRRCEEIQPDLIIGSSAGGMMTEQLYGFDRILVNPAFQMGDTMSKHGMTGKQVYQNPRQDGIQEFMVTKALVKQFADLTQQCFQPVSQSDEEQRRVWGLFGDQDPLVHTFDLFRQHYPQAVKFHGEHRLIDKVAIHYLVPVIRWIDDRQSGRERPLLYVSIDAMRDNHGQQRSNMRKTVEYLMETYDILFLVPAPTNDHQYSEEAQLWIEDIISAPAYDRVVMTNRPSVLFGDFIISTEKVDGFMGTCIQLGSPEFKCWEDIETYFERLG
ncbi:MAG: YqiA/YcfP family alpha/beta fold hydrolase [Prevotella sp.]|nr:YqiA/YcfP family alpha/beta fold hydrolase [Prevotella sp.]